MPAETSFLQSIAVPAVVAIAAAWITAQLALRRFYAEKVWERKVAAYASIFDSIHHMRQWFEEQMDADERGVEISKERRAVLDAAYERAKDELYRKLNAETWLLPEKVVERIHKMSRDLEVDTTWWQEVLDEGSAATRSAMRDLTDLVRSDLGLKRRK